MGTTRRLVEVLDLSGGRNGVDQPYAIPDGQCAEAVNVEWNTTLFAQKRRGCTNIDNGVAAKFGRQVWDLIRHTPTDEGSGELWVHHDFTGGASNSLVDRLALNVWTTSVTFADAFNPLGQPADNPLRGASFHGKLFLSYNSAQDRLHVWDGTSVRRVGLGTPAAPTVADGGGGGAYAATIRYYKIAYIDQSGTDIRRRSELSAAVSFTPSGANLNATVTKPAALGEGETHWELYGSADNSTYHLLATTLVATTTYADTTAPASYTGSAPPAAGTNVPPTSWKYLCAADNRVLGAGSYESGGKQSRVWFTPVLGASDIGDDERVPNTTALKYWLDIDEGHGGDITGLGGPLDDAIYVFKQRQIWKLIPTGNVTTPFKKVCLSRAIGCVRQQTIVFGEDEQGNPCLYFLSHRGPYRLGMNGLQYLGRDVEDLWPPLGGASTYACACYWGARHQVFWWWDNATDQNAICAVFDVMKGRPSAQGIRGGWAQYTGRLSGVTCVVGFGATYGASGSSASLVPHVGLRVSADAGTGGKVYRHGDSGVTDDAGAAYQAYVDTKMYSPGGLGVMGRVRAAHLLAKVASGVTIQQTLTRDAGLETRTSTAVLTAAASETRVLKKFEAAEMTGAGLIQARLGDAAAANNAWTLEGWAVDLDPAERR